MLTKATLEQVVQESIRVWSGHILGHGFSEFGISNLSSTLAEAVWAVWETARMDAAPADVASAIARMLAKFDDDNRAAFNECIAMASGYREGSAILSGILSAEVEQLRALVTAIRAIIEHGRLLDDGRYRQIAALVMQQCGSASA